MPGATTTTLVYSKLVEMNIVEEGDVNFADSLVYGHRVQVEVSKTSLNSFLRWERTAGSDRPVAVLGDSSKLYNALLAAFATEYNDIDGVDGGLHFSTSVFSTNTDSRIREDGLISINDIGLAFVLWKLYGNSSITTANFIFNLEDAYGMISNESVATAIVTSFENNLGALDTMFRDLLATDPRRFFDSSGNQVLGLFETNADVSGSGSWLLTKNDIIEIKTRFTFEHAVTKRGTAGNEHNITYPENGSGQDNQQTIINAGDYFYIRLQLKVADILIPSYPPSAPTGLSATAGNGQLTISFTPGNDGDSSITNYKYKYSTDNGITYTSYAPFSPAVTSSPLVITGLTNGTTYKIKLLAANDNGDGAESSAVSGTPSTTPSAPTGLSATAGNGQLTISFTPGNDGGSSITNYKYKYSTDNGVSYTSYAPFSPAVTSSPVVITGLTNGTAYKVMIRAFNNNGDGAESSAVSGTPSTTPSAPTGLSATAGNGQLTISFTPGNDGGSSITNYKYKYSTDNGVTYSSYSLFSPSKTTSPLTITGLTNGTAYKVMIRAFNNNGDGAESSAVSGTPVSPDKSTKGLLSWFTRIFTSDLNIRFLDSVTDTNGNIYLCGFTFTTNTAKDITFETFGTKVGTTITNSNAYKQSIINTFNTSVAILVKYSKTGIPLWHSYISGEGPVSFNSLGIDGSNNVYVMGTNSGNGGASTNIKTIYHINTSGQLDIYGTFVDDGSVIKLKYNSSGSVQWLALEQGFNGSLLSNGFAVDSSGSSYSMYTTNNVNTTTPGTLILYNPASSSSGTINTSTLYGTCSIPFICGSIVKRNTDGIPIWVSNLRASMQGTPCLSLDSANNLIALFSFGNLSAGNTLTITNGASKVDSSFTLTPWGTINGKSSSDTCIVKYSSSGSVLWANHFYHNSTSIGSSEYSSSLIVDASDNIYCIGTYQRNLTICNASSTGGVQPLAYGILPQTLVSGNPNTSIFIVKLNSNGQIIPNSMTNINAPNAVTITAPSGVVDPSGNLYISLRYNNTISLNNFTTDPGTTASSIVTTSAKTLSKVGTNDFVLIKYSPTFQVVFGNPMQGISASLGLNVSLAINSDGKVSALVLCTNTANQVSVYDGTDLTSNITAYIPTHTNDQAILLHYD